MKLKRKSAILVSLIVALLYVAFGLQSARGTYLPSSRTVGVQVGQWVKYSGFSEGNASGGFDPHNIPNYEMITVTGISGTNVTCQDFMHFDYNITDKTSTGVVDVETGNGNMTGFVIGANLNQGDLVYNGTGDFFPGATINETFSTNKYLGINAMVNHFSQTNLVEPAPGHIIAASFNFYWFQDSGIAVEIMVNFTQTGPGYMLWENAEMIITDTNVPEFPVSMILPLFAVLSTVAVVIAKKRLIKK